MSFDFQDKKNQYKAPGGGWFRVQEGDNPVRIVSDFCHFGIHWDNNAKKSFQCVGKDECPYCQKNLKPTVRYLGFVIDRNDLTVKHPKLKGKFVSQIKLFEMNNTVYQKIKKLKANKEYAFKDLPPYDMTINRKGTGKESKYDVIAARKNTKLTILEQSLIKKMVKDPREIIASRLAKMASDMTEQPEEEIDAENLFG